MLLFSAQKNYSCPKGFTLVEVMITVGIIMVLAVLIFPNVWRARVNSNESAAIANLRSLNSVLQLYYMNNNNNFPASLTSLTPPDSDPGYIDEELANGEKTGYEYKYTYVDGSSFYIKANPKAKGKTGSRYFYVDETGTIRQNLEGEASETDPKVE